MATATVKPSTSSALFATAIDKFLADVAQQDGKSPFFLAITALRDQNQTATKSKGWDPVPTVASQQSSQKYAEELLEFVRDVAAKRKQGTALKVLTKLEPFVRSLTGMARCCENLLQATPLAVGIIFAGARVILASSVSLQGSFDAVLGAIGDIDTYLRCFEMFLEAHPDSQDLQQNLITSYMNILQFWRESTKLLSGNVFKSLAKEILRPVDQKIKDCLQTINADRVRIQYIVQANEAKVNFQTRVERQRECIVAWIRAGEDPSKLDVRGELEDRLAVHHHGTSAWIFDDPGYKTWHDANTSSILWHNAPPGCGKTMLASQVVDNLRQSGEQVLWYLCSFDDPIRKKPLNAFRSIALQLLKITPTIPDRLISIFKEELDNHAAFLTYHRTLEKVVHELLSITKRVHIVIDGLDECLPAEESGNSVLEMIERLVSLGKERHGLTKWFFTSRKEGPILTTMANLGAIEVTPSREDLMADILTYLNDRLEENKSRPSTVEQVLMDSEANFLCAKLRADTVLRRGLTTEEEVLEEMRAFPKGLTGCYLRSLESLGKRSEREQELARRTIMILIATFQPLSLLELLDALAIRLDKDDYSNTRVPHPDLIQELCGSFISFDHSVRGSDASPVVRLGHKSVQDLFFGNPEELNVPNHLRKYFVAYEDANLEMGRNCLAYLKYKRYWAMKELPPNLETNPEHAFLRYAAVFWFSYLDQCGKPSSELRHEVREFIRSPAFWTCVRVQSLAAPYLFARYTRRSNIGYSVGGHGEEWSPSDSVGWVIPNWLGDDDDCDDCRKIIKAFHVFVVEWYEALSSGCDALCHLPMDPSWTECFPGRAKLMDKGIKRAVLGKGLDLAENGRIRVNEVFATKGVFKARLFHTTGTQAESVDWRISAPFSKQDDSTGTLPSLFAAEGNILDYLCEEAFTSSHGTVGISFKTLSVKVATPEGVKSYHAPAKITENGPPGPGLNTWSAITKTRRSTVVGVRGAVAYHFARSTKPVNKSIKTIKDSHSPSSSSSEDESEEGEDEKESEDEEEDDKSVEDDDEEFDEEEDEDEEEDSGDDDKHLTNQSSRVESSTDESDPDLDTFTDALVVISETEKPVWIPTTLVSRTQVKGAFHPSRPLYVWTSQSHELCLLDISTGRTKSCIFPEPAEFLSASLSGYQNPLIRELYFSSNGLVLHSLIVNSESDGEGLTKVVLALSSFHIDPSLDVETLKRSQLKACCETRIATYQFRRFVRSLSMPYAITQWSDDMAYVCLPLLTHSIKVIRFNLFNDADKTQPGLYKIQTLSRHIVTPASISQRNPQILYQSVASKPEDFLYITLDPDSGSGGDEHSSCRPSVIRWSVPRPDGWRLWDPVTDSRSKEVKQGGDYKDYQALRGSFVDAEKSLSVTIRGALDFTRKGFLSCH